LHLCQPKIMCSPLDHRPRPYRSILVTVVAQKASTLVLWFFWNFELMKFCQNFGETFGKFWESFVAPSSPPPPPPKTCEKFTLCKTLCKIYLGEISGEILTKFSGESFLKNIQTFVSKVSGNFRLKFWRKFPCRNTNY